MRRWQEEDAEDVKSALSIQLIGIVTDDRSWRDEVTDKRNTAGHHWNWLPDTEPGGK